MELGETFVKYLGCSVNNQLERLWKDVVVTGFDILSWHLLEQPRKAMKIVSE
jgi:hypothetical protein